MYFFRCLRGDFGARPPAPAQPTALFALFDGHSGRDVVDFTAAALFGPNLAQLIADADSGARADLTDERAIAAAYLLTDAQSHAQRHESSGTTAVSVLSTQRPFSTPREYCLAQRPRDAG